MIGEALSVALLILGFSQLATAQEDGTVRCVVVGADDYVESPLEGCVTDANSMAAFLPRQFGPARTKVIKLVDPRGSPAALSDKMVLDAIRDAAAASNEKDYFVFYYSGHGAEDGSLYLPAGEVNPTDLARELAGVKARLVTVVLDSCYSGYHKTPIEAAFANRGFVAVLAVESDQTSKTCRFANGAVCPGSTAAGSVFTRWLLKAMSDKANDQNKDGLVSWNEALQRAAKDWNAADAYSSFLGSAAPEGERLNMTPVFSQRLPQAQQPK